MQLSVEPCKVGMAICKFKLYFPKNSMNAIFYRRDGAGGRI